MIDQLVINAIAGGIGGLTRAIVGYLERPENETFRPKAFLRSLIISTLAGVTVGYTLTTHPIATFFSAMGADWLIKEGYSVVQDNKT